ncbi:MAG: hypothetical protein KGI59_00210 [Patescibacteria group bacterium]|nr:hypothetical protein [Patescibacteria group bacterium]
MMRRNNIGGFMAVIAVILLFTTTLAFSLVTAAAAADYGDSVYRRQMRIQVGENARSCLESVKVMAAKSFFWSGHIHLPEFGCNADIANDFNGHVNVSLTASLESISTSLEDAFSI